MNKTVASRPETEAHQPVLCIFYRAAFPPPGTLAVCDPAIELLLLLKNGGSK